MSEYDPHGLVKDLTTALNNRNRECANLRADLAAAQKRCNEAYGNVSALFGEFVKISGMTHLGGEVDDYGDVTKAVEKVVDDLAAARAALEAPPEWDGDGYCQWCRGNKHWFHQSYLQTGIETYHAPDCARQVALGLAKRTEETK